MHELRGVMEEHGYVITMITQDRIGYVIYEDNYRSSPNRLPTPAIADCYVQLATQLSPCVGISPTDC